MKNYKKTDITFVGSGISASFTLINFLSLLDKTLLSKKLSITIIDRYAEFNTGIPYGERSGFSTLLITSLKNFLPEPERTRFIVWLNENKTWLLEAYKNEGGVLTEQWLHKHAEEIQNNDWIDLFLPRRFFGIYIDERVKQKIKLLENKNKIEVTFIKEEVVDIAENDNTYNMVLSNDANLCSKKVILSVGSLPVQKLWKNKEVIETENLLFVNTPYEPNLISTIDKMDRFLRQRSQAHKKTNVLIIGANASALEILYKLNDHLGSNQYNLNDFVFLSTQGRTPDAVIDQQRKETFEAVHLNKLQRKNALSAKSIAKAAFEDIKESDKIQLGAASTVDTISAAFGALLTRLEYNELSKFACHYGNEIGKKQRCAGEHYTNTIENLKKQERFEHLAGRFIDLDLDETNNEYVLKYLDTETGSEKWHDKKFHLIINCVGSMNLTDNRIPKLLTRLMQKGYCKMNESKIGFAVNNALETKKNLHIMGPLLAGNVINNNAIWHVEHCGRIIWLSGILSKIMYDSFNKVYDIKTENALKSAETIESNFEVITLKRDWDLFLKDIGHYDFYHTYDYHHLASSNGENPILIKYIENNVIIGLPLLIRDIYSTIYKDATSVYGYVGPISKGVDDNFNNNNFITHLIKYFNANNIISVFSRLNPYLPKQNKILFQVGELTPQGKVICMDLKPSLEKQRGEYRNRLKTYINKARRECSVVVAKTNSDLNTFIDLYYENMDRVNAKKFYYFSKDYFRLLLKSNDFKTTVLLAVHNKTNEIIGGSMFISTKAIIQYHLSGTKAGYSKLNPTKLLIDEMRIMAHQQGLSLFNLGGGLGGSDDDSLFHFKSSFSKQSKQFNLWKWITNKQVYNELVLAKTDNTKKNYFPLYRSIEDINVQL
ncbi:GNAT family N-acetyltransferase [Tamlana fucoidanivorans]|uniref:GNAT family N-acetyltransferase n=1 Tax=Allotamlana fucoidanivorans TaxID=2583814 RepID=A0A5C4SSE4_9FLAO|nr:GNAT family N-acetyltransferase [Tamlana fucoidanivorans]TNJ46473.1 GNAT family N-acetyltransferase [Tamlana fucoidanivorans]